jgi:hypothetical protein
LPVDLPGTLGTDPTQALPDFAEGQPVFSQPDRIAAPLEGGTLILVPRAVRAPPAP